MDDHDLLKSLAEYHNELSKGRATGGLTDLRKHGYAYSHWTEWLLRNGRIMKPAREPWSSSEQAFIDNMTGHSYFERARVLKTRRRPCSSVGWTLSFAVQAIRFTLPTAKVARWCLTCTPGF